MVQKESAAIRASFREESHDSNIRYGGHDCRESEQGTDDGTDETMLQNCSTSSLLESAHISVKSNV